MQPAGCVEIGCPNMYSYEREGRTWVGCLEGVFRVEIDLERMRRLHAQWSGPW